MPLGGVVGGRCRCDAELKVRLELRFTDVYPPDVRGDARRLLPAHSHDTTRGAQQWFLQRRISTALASHRVAHAEGMDLPKGARWSTAGGHLSGPPGASASAEDQCCAA